MATFFFIIANLILLGLSLYGGLVGNPVPGFVFAFLWLSAAIIGKVTKNTNIAIFWGSVSAALLFAGLGTLGLLR
ncbi:MAG: hypothetical protein V1895_02210 [Parcubacteria group bacterium]